MTVTSAWTSPAANGTLDLDVNETLTEAVWDALISNLLWLGGTTCDWVDWTPTVTQGSGVALTVNKARYMLLGTLAVVYMRVTLTAAGTAPNDITIAGVPAAITVDDESVNSAVGTFRGLDAGTTAYTGAVVATGTTTLKLQTDNILTFLGNNPAWQLADTDVISLTAAWEIA